MLCWHKLIAIAIVLLCFFTSIKNSHAEQPQKNTVDIGINSLYLGYNASDEIKEHGMMYGIVVSYRYLYSNLMFKVEGLLNFGTVDYSSPSSERLDNADSELFERRILFGYHLPLSELSFITSYIGIGFRKIRTGLDKKFMASNETYYKTINYDYIPIGINFSQDLNEVWSYTVTAEYDIFLNGKVQYTVMNYSDFGYVMDKVNINQKSGYGLRGSVEIQKKINEFSSLAIEPFVRYWNIAESDSTDVSYYKGVQIGEKREPENHTIETGINVILRLRF